MKVCFCVLFVFTSLHLFGFSGEWFPPEVSKAERLFIDSMEKKYGFEVSAMGGGMPNGKVKSIFLWFNSKKIVDVKGARKIYIDVIEEFLVLLNNKKVQPFMENCPVTFNSLEVDISFVDEKGRFQKNGNIACIGCVCGKLGFRSVDPNTGHLDTIYREPYEESLKIVRGEIPDPYDP